MCRSAGIGLHAKSAIAVLLAATLAGCTVYAVAMSERQHAEDERACEGSGRKPGTNDFAKCLQERELMRNAARLHQ